MSEYQEKRERFRREAAKLTTDQLEMISDRIEFIEPLEIEFEAIGHEIGGRGGENEFLNQLSNGFYQLSLVKDAVDLELEQREIRDKFEFRMAYEKFASDLIITRGEINLENEAEKINDSIEEEIIELALREVKEDWERDKLKSYREENEIEIEF